MHPPDGTHDTAPRPTLLQRLRRGAEPGDAPESSAPSTPVPEAPRSPREFARGHAPGRFALERNRISCSLYDRLDGHTIDAVGEQIQADPELAATFNSVTDGDLQRHLLIHYGTWLGNRELIEATGLAAHRPPAEIHSMAHGPLAAAGGLYEADMIANAVESAGVDLSSIRAGLDFGCSSGRVLRVLAAALPEVRWMGCDPNGDAIAWAATELPEVTWFRSGNEPPLELPDGQLDLIYAISIWSHFEPLFGLRWFAEMRRLLAPGGLLVFTAHGLTTLAYDAERDLRPLAECDEIERALYRDGRWYIDCFGEEGDWGVVSPHWGNSFMTPEFVLEQLCPRWRVVEFVAGRNQERQDVYVLARA